MGIVTNNPVLEREIRGRLRLKRRGGLTANVWIARILGLIVAYYYVRGMMGIWRGTLQDAHEFWPLLVYGALVLIVLLAPALSATAITQEREQQTWEILATTQLSAVEVLGGKWIGRQMIPWLLLLILLPYLGVTTARAEMNSLLLPAVVAFLLVTTAFYSALGLLCSFQARRTMTATATALTFSAVLCIGTVVIDQVLDLFLFHGFTGHARPILWLNPFYTLQILSDQLAPGLLSSDQTTDPAAPGWYFILMIAATAAALGFMVRRYHHSVRERS